jgi:NADPH-dependent curcumin reductase CurA
LFYQVILSLGGFNLKRYRSRNSTLSNIITNRRIVLAERPTGRPGPDNFRLETVEMPEAGPGEIITRTIWLSLAPYMFWRMRPEKSYAPPVGIGEVMVGGTVGEVVISNHPDFKPGDLALGGGNWQEYAVLAGAAAQKIDPAWGSPALSLNVLGGNGLTAYAGLYEIGKPKAGETVAVAAASGGVGSLVGQYAKLRGARAVGIAGGAEKCAFVVKELGFDACVDHRSANFAAELKAACPAGIDVYFENVGGPVFEAVFPLLNDFARIPVCGLISQYTATTAPEGPNQVPNLMRAILSQRLMFRGFISSDFNYVKPQFFADTLKWLGEGKLKFREDITEGLENAPEALMSMLDGKNFGKVLVRVGHG